MGPRSHERGNALRQLPRELKGLVLQWGRVLMNAETGAVRILRRILSPASMGPRSHERGNVEDAERVPPGAPRFNGAAFS